MAHPETLEPGYCVEADDSSFQNAVEEFILLVTTQDLGKTSQEDFVCEEIDSIVTPDTSEQNGSKNVPNEQIIFQGRQVYEGSRPEICGISELDISTSSDTVAIKSDSRNDICATSSQVALEKCSTGVSLEYKSIKESHSHNRNFNAADKITDSEDFKAKGSFSVAGFDVSCENVPQTKLCMENLKNGSPLKLQTLEMKCSYSSLNVNTLLSHSIAYYPTKFYCDACKVSYSDEGSHGSSRTCDVCKEIFECKVKLEDHYLIHEEFHATHCRICHSEIDKHECMSEGRNQYRCCECGYSNVLKSLLKRHLFNHSHLRLFKCEYCEMRFKQTTSLRKHLNKFHSECKMCGKRFVNNNSLDKHRLEEHS